MDDATRIINKFIVRIVQANPHLYIHQKQKDPKRRKDTFKTIAQEVYEKYDSSMTGIFWLFIALKPVFLLFIIINGLASYVIK